MRLHHFISTHSNHSRRAAERLILEGHVKVNGKVATQKTRVPEIAISNPKKAQSEFSVAIYDKPLNYAKSFEQKKHWSAIVYHKKKGELVSKKDDRGRVLIYDSLDSKYTHFMPVGRLDFASEGLLILSDNKEVVTSLMTSNLKRVYLVKIDTAVSKKMIDAMLNGISIKNAKAGGHKLSKVKSMDYPPMEFEILKSGNISKLKLILNQGRNREIRRFFAHFNANVMDLKRVSYGFINLNALPVGKTRFFTKDEYKQLKEFMGYKVKQGA